MATTIVTKFGGDAPAASDIVRGELAVDTENGRLYTENSSGAVVEIGLNPEGNVDVTGTVTASGEIIAASLDISGDIDVDGTANLDVVDIDGAVDMATTLAVGGVVTANAGVVVDNITIDGQEIDVSSGDLTLDVAGNIKLDADDNGEIRCLDGGTQYAAIKKDGNNALFQSIVADGDFIIQGIDGSSFVSALTLDMSAAGAATFNAGATFGGNVGIGASAPARPLHVSTSGVIPLRLTSTGTDCQIELGNSGGTPIIGSFNDQLIFNTASTERMRIDSSGNLLVGCTALPSGGAGGVGFETGQSGGRTILQVGTTVTTAEGVARFYNPNGAIGSISLSGSATAFNTSSDQRLKENIVDAPSASDDIDAIQVRSFDWKADGSHQKYGMVAQELQSVAPEAVSGDADSEEMMGVDYSKLVPMMLKEIQSLRARVAQLES
jgi:cytoskeletal protein CcmA (bactofilin family)